MIVKVTKPTCYRCADPLKLNRVSLVLEKRDSLLLFLSKRGELKIRMKDVLEELSFMGFDEGSLEISALFTLSSLG